MTRSFHLLGDPVAHSLSPAIHAAAFATWGEDARYDALRVSVSEVAATMRRAAERGGGGNVTLPHKLAAARALDAASPEVELTGACNCFWGEGGRLVGDNTDIGGLSAALDELGVDVAGRAVLLLGAGGAARAALVALGRRGVGRVDIRNRTPRRARRLAGEIGEVVIRVLEDPAPEDPGEPYALVLNATRLGLGPEDERPADLERLRTEALYDMVYAAGGTAFVREARARGIRAADGLSMLVHQAALSLAHWFPDRPVPVDRMRSAAEAALTGRG